MNGKVILSRPFHRRILLIPHGSFLEFPLYRTRLLHVEVEASTEDQAMDHHFL